MQIEFKLIHYDKPIKNLDSTIYSQLMVIAICVPLLIASMLLLDKNNFGYIMLSLFALVFFLHFIYDKYIRTLFSDWVKKEDIIGKLVCNSNTITVKENQKKEVVIPLTSIKEMTLYYNYYQGANYYRQPIYNGLAQLDIYLNDDNKQSYIFLIKDKVVYNNFKTLLNSWYSITSMKEFFGNEKIRTMQLNFNPKYSDFQKVRNK
ncbi:MAG: hypothetical protein H6553_07315 [Chitinophagales bacterium]|nr:hypothetical protein [Chitinophagales bacterium]